MKHLLCLLAAVLFVAFVGCGDESDDSTEVAGSTSDLTTEIQAEDSGDASDDYEETGTEQDVPQGQLPDDERVYADHPGLTTEDAIATIEHYFYGPYDRETCELLTAKFLRQSYGSIDGCVLGAGELATKITITPGKVTETEATGFEVDAEGSVYTGETVTVDLVAADNGWLISDLSVDAPVGP